jgi:hypothetical protein
MADCDLLDVTAAPSTGDLQQPRRASLNPSLLVEVGYLKKSAPLIRSHYRKIRLGL